MTSHPAPTSAQSVWLWRAVPLLLLWMVISEGNLSAWSIGIPSILLATWLSLKLNPPSALRMRFKGLLQLIVYFAIESWRGGLDVAKRILSPKLNIAPTTIDYHPRLPDGLARVLFSYCVSLLPGTLSVRLHEDRLQVHVLDQHSDPIDALQALETRIAAVLMNSEVPHA